MERWQLKQMEHNPIVRHVLYLMDERDRVKKELKVAELEHGRLEDQIFCAKEAIKLLQQGES